MAELEQTLVSTEIADMIEKSHSNLIRDIRRYIEHFIEANIGFNDFFKESTYKDAKGETRPCYRITKKGCEFIAHKLTGTKGTIFTARYINRFHEMENILMENTMEPDLPWFIRKFRGRYIVLERDFITITGVDIRKHKLFYREEYFRPGRDWNGLGTADTVNHEKFLQDYGFEYGNDEVMFYLYLSGVKKALEILNLDKKIEMKAGANEVLTKGISQTKPVCRQRKQSYEATTNEGYKQQTSVSISFTLNNKKAELVIH